MELTRRDFGKGLLSLAASPLLMGIKNEKSVYKYSDLFIKVDCNKQDGYGNLNTGLILPGMSITPEFNIYRKYADGSLACAIHDLSGAKITNMLIVDNIVSDIRFSHSVEKFGGFREVSKTVSVNRGLVYEFNYGDKYINIPLLPRFSQDKINMECGRLILTAAVNQNCTVFNQNPDELFSSMQKHVRNNHYTGRSGKIDKFIEFDDNMIKYVKDKLEFSFTVPGRRQYKRLFLGLGKVPFFIINYENLVGFACLETDNMVLGMC